jgi:hypothetical protein
MNVNLGEIPKAGEIRKIMCVSNISRNLGKLNIDERFHTEKMYLSLFRKLVEDGMFTIKTRENWDGSFDCEISIEVKVPRDYGTPKWESLENKKI